MFEAKDRWTDCLSYHERTVRRTILAIDPQIGLYVTTTPGLSEKELAETFDIWQLKMFNYCNFGVLAKKTD